MDMNYGSRRELIDALTEQAEGWDHQENARLAVQAEDAVSQLREGARVVQVGHQLYEVTD